MSALSSLLKDEFLLRVSSVSTGQGLFDFLVASQEVKDLRTEIQQESIGSTEVAEFVRQTLASLKSGQRFSYDAALAALTVALDLSPRDFASTLIDELSALRIREIPLAPRVASLVKARRQRHLAKQTVRVYQIDNPTNILHKIFAPGMVSYGVTRVPVGAEEHLPQYWNNSYFNAGKFLERHAA